jgi:DNA invertase Pin-like site-specific DNA recombinase
VGKKIPNDRCGSRVVIEVEFERNQVTSRTDSALAAAEARGVKLGAAGPANLRRNIESRQAAANYFANRLSGVLAAFRADGLSQRATVQQLNVVGIGAPNGRNWSLLQSSEWQSASRRMRSDGLSDS